ncbi:DnaA regulatory inactivator Hda [Arsukibacterium sp.]|uniref:DnaA regulatory inactivator Hda n=1 Tax=Arsukibacterium sp. TaxID=1977258 RepID=UPI00299EB817|nr:DnaA regulatory inactivator Hda [Arsukibacterium sp.]MDX1676844.1 DnaA regulatory inactivator Hda [Arsukibacterium sp.]
MQPLQYTLAVTLPDDETLDSFYTTGQTEIVSAVKCYLNAPDKIPPLYVFGASGSGKSHLLYASCIYAQEQGLTSQLLALQDYRALSPRLLDDLEQLDLVCLDNIQAIADDLSWQIAVFDLYNRMVEQGKALFIVANQTPARLGFKLADLISRLQACQSLQLRLLTDDDKQKLLQQKAYQRGMELGDDVARFLLNRYQRDIRSLVAILDKLDKASIVHQRKLTIPFIKSILL